tara:strand:- start:21563 stop:21784 length:222 start_codon:yes stop_codon:yes gene_type:complete
MTPGVYPNTVVHAKAGAHFATKLGLPATAKLIPRNAFCGILRWIPAYAGMTKRAKYDVNLVWRLIPLCSYEVN